MVCRALRNYHLQNKHMDYIRIISNKDYQIAMGYSKEETQQYINEVWKRHLELSAFDEIVNGKRRKKQTQYIGTCVESK